MTKKFCWLVLECFCHQQPPEDTKSIFSIDCGKLYSYDHQTLLSWSLYHLPPHAWPRCSSALSQLTTVLQVPFPDWGRVDIYSAPKNIYLGKITALINLFHLPSPHSPLAKMPNKIKVRTSGSVFFCKAHMGFKTGSSSYIGSIAAPVMEWTSPLQP